MRSLIRVLALVLSFGLSSVTAAELVPAANGYHKQRVVYHISDAQVANMAMIYIQNHINAVGAGNADIVVVTHGKGIDFLLDGWKDNQGKSFDTVVHDLATQGVEFDVCKNTLDGRKISSDAVNMNATVVPSGVATLGELQLKGYVYIKP